MKKNIVPQASVSSAAPLSPVDISTVDLLADGADWTLTVRLTSLSANAGSPSITLNIEVSYDGFATIHNAVTMSAHGPIVPSADVVRSWRAYQFEGIGFGVGFIGAEMRVNITSINGTATVDAWVAQ